MTDHANIVRERVSHIARGCRAGTSHNPAVYENDINAALDALVAEIRSLNEQVVGAVDLLEGAVAERDEARAWAFARSDVEEYIKRAEAAEAEVELLRKALARLGRHKLRDYRYPREGCALDCDVCRAQEYQASPR